MGGAVSSGRDNNELIDNLMSGNYIRTRQVEAVFRALDRADYMTPEARDQAYKDLAWRNGPLHLSSPCIYSEVMEGLELRPGLSFLNVGSGTGYLSSLVGLILGTSGISHGVEVHPAVVEYATKKISQFIENSPTLDEFDFCEPKYFIGNALCLTPPLSGYDRVYCGAACPVEYEMYFKQLLKVGGLLVMPLNDTLLQVRRVGPEKWVSRSLLNVSFAPLRPPTAEESTQNAKLDPLRPVRLQLLSRAVVRRCMRGGVLRRHPELQQGPRFPPPAACPRRICIPIEPGGSVEGLNVLHDLDNESGANEMNALLSLVISMGQNRVAGALRFDRVDSDSSDDENEAEAPETDRPNDPENDRPDAPVTDRHDAPEADQPDAPENDRPDASETDRANGGPDGLPDDRPKDIDLPVSDSESKSNENMDSSGLGDTPSVLRRRPADGFEYRNGQSHANGTRRRPRPSGDSVDDKSAPGNAMRELVRKRREARPSTSTSQSKSSMFEALKNTEEMAKKETVVENEEKTDNMTGPPKRELPGVPSVVEIELGEASDMEWDPEYAEALEAAARRLADPDVDEDEPLKNGPKRQKLDGGIAENGSDGKSPDGSKDEETDPERPGDGGAAGGAGGADTRSWSPGPEERAHTARRRRREARGGGARRVRLSLLMKQAVRELPLPHALKKFVNLGRCFEF